MLTRMGTGVTAGGEAEGAGSGGDGPKPADKAAGLLGPHTVALALILLVAVALRVWRPGLAEFKLDEVQPVALADVIWREHRLPLTRGYSSTGLPGTPLVAYLLVLPRAFTDDPRAAVVTIALLGSLAVLATYLGARRFAGERLALVAAALLAVNPWAVLLARKTWSDVLPLLGVLIVWSAFEVVVHGRKAWAAAFFPLLALQFQAHVLAILCLPAALLTVALYWRRWKTRYTLYGVASAALILLPYAAALAMRRGEIRAVLRQNVGGGLLADLEVFRYALRYASGATATSVLGQSVQALAGWEQALQVVGALTALLLATALGYCLWRAVRRRPPDERLELLLVWLVGPVLPLVFIREAKDIHYLSLLVPALFILAAMAWTRLLNSRRRALAVGSALALAAVLALQAGSVWALYGGLSRLPAEGGFGRPLQAWLPLREGVRGHLAAGGWSEMQLIGVDDAPWSTERNVLDCLFQASARLRYVGFGGRPGLLVPTEGEALVLALGADGELARTLADLGVEQERWPLAGFEGGAGLYVIAGQEPGSLSAGATLAGPGTFENGMRLLAARLPEQAGPGDVLVATTYWTYVGGGTHPAETAFTHLVDGTGQRWAQDDGFALSRAEWRPGETLLQWYRIALPADLPPGEYWLYTGMYSVADMSRSQLLADDGSWLADGVTFGPIRVLAR